MRLVINGETKELPEGLTTRALLDQLQIDPRRVVVEVNLQLVKRERLDQVTLHEGDHVEIVQFVGGG